MTGITSLIGRILIAAMFVLSGINKITGFSGTLGYMESAGIPMAGVLLPLVILLEIGGGLAIVIGWYTRSIALVFALFCVATALLFHLDPSNQTQMIMFMKNIAIAGGFLFLVAHGPGALSVDRR